MFAGKMMLYFLTGSLLISVLCVISVVVLNNVENFYGIQHHENITATSNFLPQKLNQTELVIVTKVENNCLPRVLCGDVRAEDFQVQVFGYQDEKQLLSTLGESFPGSAQGRTVTLFPQFIQYDIKQWNPSLGRNVTVDLSYSNGCSGFEFKVETLCIITAKLTNAP
jgi:hypothetical protein